MEYRIIATDCDGVQTEITSTHDERIAARICNAVVRTINLYVQANVTVRMVKE